MLVTGCAGFPARRSLYFQRCGLVEIEVDDARPRLDTVARWRAEAPRSFQFAVRAPKALARSLGDAGEAALAWDRMRAVARASDARFLVFETPSVFGPGAESLRCVYRFFKAAKSERRVLVWHPLGAWQPALVAKVCAELGLRAACLLGQKPTGPAYFRLPAGRSDTELAAVAESCRAPSAAVFVGPGAFRDAARLGALARRR